MYMYWLRLKEPSPQFAMKELGIIHCLDSFRLRREGKGHASNIHSFISHLDNDDEAGRHPATCLPRWRR